MEAKNPIVWFEIYVDDIERAKKFYQEILTVSFSEIPSPTEENLEMWAFPSNMERYGASGVLAKMEGFNAGGNSTIVYFKSDDCAIEESRIDAAGGKVFKSKQSIGEFGFMCLGIDTEGNMFGLHSMS